MKLLFPSLASLLVLSSSLSAAEPQSLEDARKEYEQSKARDPEAAREHLVTALAKQMHTYVEEYRKTGSRDHSDEMQDLMAELRKYPAPAGIDSKKLKALMPGVWVSPRHEYLYKADGTDVMLPEEPGATRGKWRIEGNKVVQTMGGTEYTYTIILLNEDYFVYSDKNGVFFMARQKKQ